MSYLFQNNENLESLSILIGEIKEKKINEDIVKKAMSIFTPKDKQNILLVEYSFSDFSLFPALFNPRTNSIVLNPNSLKSWLNKNVDSFCKDYKDCKRDDLEAYFTLFAFAHENAHAKQYLIGKNKLVCNSKVLQESYKGLYELFTFKEHFIKTPGDYKKRLSLLLYKMRENSLFLERNANIEAFDLLSKLAEYEEKESTFDIFQRLKLLMCTMGYLDNNNGSIEETYKKILMLRKYKSFYQNENLDTADKITYGLPISNAEKQELFQKVKKISK